MFAGRLRAWSTRERHDRSVKSAHEDFAAFSDDVWLNCAHQGPLPLVAAQAAERAIEWKKLPYELTAERFSETPALLRQAISRLIHADGEDVTLANSASYGLHVIARGIRWSVGDEVIVMEGDFPSDILPWLLLEARGVTVRRVRPRGYVFEPDELAAVIGSKTRLVCLTWVHSFSGWAIDLDAVGAVCKERGVTFIVNGSQAVGARPLDVQAASVDAVISVGFKWLCGPYGTVSVGCAGN
jgi:cysteine desulfurase/selenocysteine lyase